MTRLEQCKRLGGPDRWTFHAVFTFPHGEVVELSGPQAQRLWGVWKAYAYNEMEPPKTVL